MMVIAALAMACAMAMDRGFGVAEIDGRSWLITPDGKRFLSYGVCCIDQGTKSDKKDPLNPSYSAFDHYKSSQDWTKATQKRLIGWGFNTVGAWSEHSLLRNPSLYQMPVLHLSATGIPWVDPWDKDTIEAANKQAKEMIDGWKSDPNVIGYFSDNELGWWIGAIFEWAFKYKANSAGRKVFVDLLRKEYKTWEAVSDDFTADKANSFDSLLRDGRLYLKPSSHGMAFVKIWLGTVARQYYKISREAIKKADPKALFLGDRYISNFYPEVVTAASDYVDVLSTNFNADWNNGKSTPFYLPTLHELGKKPILITEFYVAAMENQSGNSNDSSGFPTVRTQRDRVSCFLKQVEAMRKLPYVVGAHWFQYYDEAMHGRGDGENYNMGLVDIYDKPYTLLTEATKRTFKTVSKPGKPETSKGNIAPHIHPSDAVDLSRWDIDKSSLPMAEPAEARGDMFACWNASGIYLAFHWYEDRFFEALFPGNEIPKTECSKISICINKLTIEAKADGISKIDLNEGHVLSYIPGNGESGNTRNTLIIRIPARALGVASLKNGAEYRLKATLMTRADAYKMFWNSAIKLAR